MLFLNWLCRPVHADREDTPLCPFRDESISTLRPCSTFETSNPSFSYISSGTLLDINIQKVRRNVSQSLCTASQYRTGSKRKLNLQGVCAWSLVCAACSNPLKQLASAHVQRYHVPHAWLARLHSSSRDAHAAGAQHVYIYMYCKCVYV